jgi:hypothetical protein
MAKLPVVVGNPRDLIGFELVPYDFPLNNIPWVNGSTNKTNL